MSIEIKRKLERMREYAAAKEKTELAVVQEHITKLKLGLASQREKVAAMPAAHPDRAAIVANTAEVEQALVLFEAHAGELTKKKES